MPAWHPGRCILHPYTCAKHKRAILSVYIIRLVTYHFYNKRYNLLLQIPYEPRYSKSLSKDKRQPAAIHPSLFPPEKSRRVYECGTPSSFPRQPANTCKSCRTHIRSGRRPYQSSRFSRDFSRTKAKPDTEPFPTRKSTKPFLFQLR